MSQNTSRSPRPPAQDIYNAHTTTCADADTCICYIHDPWRQERRSVNDIIIERYTERFPARKPSEKKQKSFRDECVHEFLLDKRTVAEIIECPTALSPVRNIKNILVDDWIVDLETGHVSVAPHMVTAEDSWIRFKFMYNLDDTSMLELFHKAYPGKFTDTDLQGLQQDLSQATSGKDLMNINGLPVRPYYPTASCICKTLLVSAACRRPSMDGPTRSGNSLRDTMKAIASLHNIPDKPPKDQVPADKRRLRLLFEEVLEREEPEMPRKAWDAHRPDDYRVLTEICEAKTSTRLMSYTSLITRGRTYGYKVVPLTTLREGWESLQLELPDDPLEDKLSEFQKRYPYQILNRDVPRLSGILRDRAALNKSQRVKRLELSGEGEAVKKSSSKVRKPRSRGRQAASEQASQEGSRQHDSGPHEVHNPHVSNNFAAPQFDHDAAAFVTPQPQNQASQLDRVDPSTRMSSAPADPAECNSKPPALNESQSNFESSIHHSIPSAFEPWQYTPAAGSHPSSLPTAAGHHPMAQGEQPQGQLESFDPTQMALHTDFTPLQDPSGGYSTSYPVGIPFCDALSSAPMQPDPTQDATSSFDPTGVVPDEQDLSWYFGDHSDFSAINPDFYQPTPDDPDQSQYNP